MLSLMFSLSAISQWSVPFCFIAAFKLPPPLNESSWGENLFESTQRANNQILSLVFQETVPQRKIRVQEQTHLLAHPQQTAPQTGGLPRPALYNRHNPAKQ